MRQFAMIRSTLILLTILLGWGGHFPERQAHAGPSAAPQEALPEGGFPGLPLYWKELTGPSVLSTFPGMVYDEARDRLVLYDGMPERGAATGHTYEWTGTAWEQAATTGPPASRSFALVYDSGRERTVYFSGREDVIKGAASTGTWEWDGSEWQEASLDGPVPEGEPVMAYDEAREVTVLYVASTTSIPPVGETWQWDGTEWEQVATGGPPPREGAAMAYDSARERIVLFGGSEDRDIPVGDTWEWDGTDWHQVATTGPSARFAATMAYDKARERTVLAGGFTDPGIKRDHDQSVWEWDGTEWHEIEAEGPPTTISGRAMAYDGEREKVVLYTGMDDDVIVLKGFLPQPEQKDRLWEWDGSEWEDTTPLFPSARRNHVMVWDSTRERAVLFGGSGQLNGDILLKRATGGLRDTWEWDGTEWFLADEGEGETPRPGEGAAAAYDAQREQVVLFGGMLDDIIKAGEDTSQPAGIVFFSDETWLWDGTQWQEAEPAAKPIGRINHAMAYDPSRERTVLFGGRDGSILLDDTWEWDGNNWHAMDPTSAPSLREHHAMVYDQNRGTIVLFGGHTTASGVPEYVNDMWEWDGTDWTEISPAGQNAPSPRGRATVVFNTFDERVVLFGGHDQSESFGDVWQFDGTAWLSFGTPTPRPEPRYGHGMVYHPYSGQSLIFGGWGEEQEYLGDAWLLGPDFQIPPGARAIGNFSASGCTGFPDFVFLLENWGEVIDGEAMSFADFVALLENWGQGPDC